MEQDLLEEGENQTYTNVSESESLTYAINTLTNAAYRTLVFANNLLDPKTEVKDATYHIQLILNKYIEQSGLLDEHISSWILPLAD